MTENREPDPLLPLAMRPLPEGKHLYEVTQNQRYTQRYHVFASNAVEAIKLVEEGGEDCEEVEGGLSYDQVDDAGCPASDLIDTLSEADVELLQRERSEYLEGINDIIDLTLEKQTPYGCVRWRYVVTCTDDKGVSKCVPFVLQFNELTDKDIANGKTADMQNYFARKQIAHQLFTSGCTLGTIFEDTDEMAWMFNNFNWSDVPVLRFYTPLDKKDT